MPAPTGLAHLSRGLWLHCCHLALQEGDRIGCQQAAEGGSHLVLGGCPSQQLVQQWLENKAVTLVNQRDLRRAKVRAVVAAGFSSACWEWRDAQQAEAAPIRLHGL